MAKYCTNCGTKVDDNIAFCPECGQKFDYLPADQPMQQNQPTPPVQAFPNQPVNYQNGYNPYDKQANYNSYNNQQNSYTPPNYQGYQASNTTYANMAESLKWTSYTGRLNRMRYFLRGLGLSFASFIVAFVFAFAAAMMGVNEDVAISIGYIFCIPIFVLSYFNSMKRAHDLDKSGWIILVSLIPIVNIIFSLYLLFAKGTEGPNKYGDDPLTFR